MAKDFYSENHTLFNINESNFKENTGTVHFQIAKMMRSEMFSTFIIGYQGAIELNEKTLPKIVEDILLKGFSNNLPENLNILQRTFTSLLIINPTKENIKKYINDILMYETNKIKELNISNINLKDRLIRNVIQALNEILVKYTNDITCIKIDIYDKVLNSGSSYLSITNYNDDINFGDSMLLSLSTVSEFVEKDDVIIGAEEHKGIISVGFNILPLYIDKYLFTTNDSLGILNEKGFIINYTAKAYDNSLIKLKFNFELNEEFSFMKDVNKFKEFTNMIKNLQLQYKGEKTNLSQLDYISLKLKSIEISEDFTISVANHKKIVAIVLANNIVFGHSDERSEKYRMLGINDINELYNYELYKPYFDIKEENDKVIMNFNDLNDEYGFNIEPLSTLF